MNFRRLLGMGLAGIIFSMTVGHSVADEKPLRVALFCDPASTDKKSREAAWKVLSGEAHFKADRITTETVRNGALKDYDVLVIPGGTANGEARALGLDGCAEVTRFVKEGRGAVAICAGGYLVVKGWNPETKAIELANAVCWDDDHWARGEAFINVKVIGADDNDSSRTMWFENGPIFAPWDNASLPPYTPLVRYVTDMAAKDAPRGMMTGRDAVIAAPLGKGRVVAFGPHPELSPNLNHWLVNSVKWAARGDNGTSPTAATVLEGQPATSK
ncbi:MAG: hypothetical protein K1X53_13490 [Candidatus Sumerlaeaceae bacterium]|nr:hypothetical protein [Candidatus Sumerlaeaceae bacterium]